MTQDHIEQFFSYTHLPEHLQAVSKPFGEMAEFILTLPRNPERTAALRKLLESKDAAVRAVVAKDVSKDNYLDTLGAMVVTREGITVEKL